MNKKFILLAIIIVAVVLRFYRLGEVPMGLFGDEVDAGYNAYSFLKTGSDYNGNWMPVHFESMGDYRPFGFILGLVPSIAIFGLSDFSVRLVPAIFGVLGTLLIYLVVKEWGDEKWALVSAGTMAIIPWHIHYSRAGFEVTMMLALILLGVWSMLKARSNPSWLWLGTIALAYATYTYNVAKLYAPWIWVLTLWFLRKKIWRFKRTLLMNVLLFVLCLLPLAYDSIWGAGQNRFDSLSIFNDQKVVEKVNYARGQMVGENIVVQKVFKNRFVGYGQAFLFNYLKSWNFSWLFFSGQADNPRHGVSDWGLFYWWMSPLLLLGLGEVWKERSKKFNKWILWWLFTASVPASLTIQGGNHATRLFVLIVPLTLLVAKGWLRLLTMFRRYTLFIYVGLAILASINLAYYLEEYYVHYSQNHYRAWEYGMEDAITYALNHENDYKHVIVTKSYIHLPMLYYLFYSKYDPRKLHEQFRLADKGLSPSPTDEIGKFKFLTINVGDATRPSGSLDIAAYPGDETRGWKQIGVIASPDKNDDKPILLLLKSENE